MPLKVYSFDPLIPPSDNAWHGCEENDDSAWAYREFGGKTSIQARLIFDADVIEGAESINFMPNGAFKYYMVALSDYVNGLDFKSSDNAASAASCLFGYLEVNAKSRPVVVADILPLVRPVLERLVEKQDENDMSIDAYGDLDLRMKEIIKSCVNE